MSALIEKFVATSSIKKEIESHVAWLGHVSGLKADKMLRGNEHFTYVLRTGEYESEEETAYYVSFVASDDTVRHQPIVITITAEGWCYENCMPGGPYVDKTIDDVLHLIMHCKKNECQPLKKWA